MLAQIAEQIQANMLSLEATDSFVTGSLPEDATAQFYSGLLYAYTGQHVDERDYIVDCAIQSDDLD